LVEVIVTLAIVAISTAVVVPAIGNISRAQLRRTARGLSSTIRKSYDEAALSGQMQRIVFTVGPGHRSQLAGPDAPALPPVRLEAAERALMFDDKGGAVLAAAEQDDVLESMEAPPLDGSATDAGPADKKGRKAAAGSGGALQAMAGIHKLAQGDEEDNFKPKGAFALGDGVHVMDVWTEGMDQPMADGEASLFFFAHGYTQNASIHLEDANRNVFTVTVDALTGRTTVLDGYVERPK
jgi:type II secretory pathway pseudopilin PulG